ncbi:peptide chain release factor N(5)-glutamine methyltransferase [Rubrobacter indicoceani]|uniref:peptide chain release factor N(5)-glutamine methyltransferase n=1 Tax=Rubrobacter indicoceani TaxID=2051957 RepID=UPI0013C4CF70|nr:peptide chain release factor N(5)-glutamine methyltransferase [Rubrobacter indicoceani]
MRARIVHARDVVSEAASRLRGAEVPEPQASAEVLLSELLDIRRGEIPFYSEPLTQEQSDEYAAMISRREAREPVQRILGRAYFRNLTLRLAPQTLIPRPDTESIVDVVLERVEKRPKPCRVLDLGTGTGAIAISIAQESPACDVHASDISASALDAAEQNAEANGATVAFHRSDLAVGLDELAGGVHVLVSNPPYIERETLAGLSPEVRDWDPPVALDGGADGLDFYRRIFDEARPLLKPNADIVLEVGDGQAEDVLRLGGAAGFTPLETHRDLAESVRCVTLRWHG